LVVLIDEERYEAFLVSCLKPAWVLV